MVFLAKRLGDLTTDDLGGMIVIMIGVMVVLGVASMIIIKKKSAENDSKPVLAMKARIIDKMRENPGEVAFVIWVLFETADGDRVKLSCSAKNDYVVGDIGFLRWQGSRLISFEREK